MSNEIFHDYNLIVKKKIVLHTMLAGKMFNRVEKLWSPGRLSEVAAWEVFPQGGPGQAAGRTRNSGAGTEPSAGSIGARR